MPLFSLKKYTKRYQLVLHKAKGVGSGGRGSGIVVIRVRVVVSLLGLGLRFFSLEIVKQCIHNYRPS